MKKGILVVVFVFSLFVSGYAQVVTTVPEFPTAGNAVTVYFDATRGNQALMDFDGDIYAHTGLITENSSSPSNWQYVIAEWSENTEKAKLTKVSDNYYQLEITPSINEFYEVAEGEEVYQLAFVFRNSNGTIVAREADGGDIFAEVYPPGLSINISSPAEDLIIEPGDTVNITASSNESDSMYLWIDDVLLDEVEGMSISVEHIENIEGSHKIKVGAKNTDETVFDSVYYYVRGSNQVAELPAGWKKGINYLADDSVGLVLFAPFKEYVFVLGDFTDWRVQEGFMMNVTPDGEYYWLGIGNLTPQQEYIFQYYIDGTLKIADPYTEKTSDPNDKYIPESTYPGLIEYPESQTTQIASVVQTAQDEYQWVNTAFDPPEKDQLIIYELLIRDFLAAHDYQTLIDTLDYLDSLGVNAIELMPFNEFEGNESWGYNPSFYFAPDKYYGPKEDLKAFVDSCHGRGIAVIMDMVLNHSYGQSPLVRMYFDPEAGDYGQPTPENPWYNTTSPNQTYSWGFDFDHESDYTKEFVDSVNRFWLEKYKIDGFRFDFTKGFTNTPGDGWTYDQSRIDILERMALQIWEVNPNAHVILEHLADNSEEKVLAEKGMLLWGNMNYPYGQAGMGYASELSGISYQDRGWSVPHLVGYMESHDEERLMYRNLTYGNSYSGYDITSLETALKRVELAANFFVPVPGPKMIWQFGELGYDISIDYPCRVCNKPILWNYYEEDDRYRLYLVFKTLFQLKEKYEVFRTADFTISEEGNTKSINLYGEDMNVVILGNFDVTTAFVNASFPSTGQWYELYSGDTLKVAHQEEMISLKAGEYRFYSDQKLQQPVFPSEPTGIFNDEVALNQQINVYPNPSADFFNFDVRKITPRQGELYIYDTKGQQVFSRSIHGQEIIRYDSTGIPGGIYFFRIVTDESIYTGKILKRE
ncbi:MAG: alpha-amylase family glycosyl hydrolase [Bacteroidales bacterium]|nr:alpha-amylase family glycosyl hydrolase [Bacteroidales bacterium]